MSTVLRSLKHPDVVKFLRLSADKKLRYSWKKCIISSPALIKELSSRSAFDDIILDKKPKSEISYRYKTLWTVTPKILQRIGRLKNSRAGIIATLPIPTPISTEVFPSNRILVLDGVEDLGELGTLLRSALAFDWEAVWITHNSGDPFDPVCIRSSQGALFTLPYRVGSIDNALKHIRREHSILKLRFNCDIPSRFRLGVVDPELDESSLVTESGSICLVVQKSSKGSPKMSDFVSIQPSGTTQDRSLPLSVSASSLMYILKNRYFPS